MILAIDPGKNQGWAVLNDSGILSSCGLGCPPTGHYSLLVVEKPQVYPNTPVKQSNDLISVAISVGRAIEQYPANKVLLVVPHDWKGSVPKPIHNARVLNALTLSELNLIPSLAASLKHNVIDAIGLAKWAVLYK